MRRIAGPVAEEVAEGSAEVDVVLSAAKVTSRQGGRLGLGLD